jgi:hypothetical protein
VFEKMMGIFHADGGVNAILVDSTMICAHACAAGAPKKKGVKRHKP